MREPTERVPVPPLPPVPAAGGPKRSIVVVSTSDRAFLERSLSELIARLAAQTVDVVVVRNGSPAEAQALGRLFRGVRFIAQPGGTTDDLRVAGIRAASGDVVTLMRDTAFADAAEVGVATPVAPFADALPCQPADVASAVPRVRAE